jgi:hypothetical protein
MTPSVHIDIPPIKTYVAKKFLYGMDEAFNGQWERCKIFAVSSYKTEALTVKAVLCANGGVFDYLPLHAFSQTQQESELGLNDLCYHACPSWNIAISVHDELKKQPCWSWFKKVNKFVKGSYHCTVDWFDANTNVNIVLLENGQIASVPNHKCLFVVKEPDKLPDYRALHSTWKI